MTFPYPGDDDDDDFQDPVVGSISATKRPGKPSSIKVFPRGRRGSSGLSPLRSSDGANRSNKRAKVYPACTGKENEEFPPKILRQLGAAEGDKPEANLARLSPDVIGRVSGDLSASGISSLVGDPVESSIDSEALSRSTESGEADRGRETETLSEQQKMCLTPMSPEERSLKPCSSDNDNTIVNDRNGEDPREDFDAGTQLTELMNLCWEAGEEGFRECEILEDTDASENSVECPLCRTNITDLTEELRLAHTNLCLDREEQSKVTSSSAGVAPVVEWLKDLDLSRYEEVFLREEIDWDTLQCLTEEDLLRLGINALGPRKKILNALNIMRGNTRTCTSSVNSVDKEKTYGGNKLITEFFRVPQVTGPAKPSSNVDKTKKVVGRKGYRSSFRNQDIPPWCCIPGTPFRVDAFRYTRGDCSHWFLTHFHLDHYQGLTKNFHHGKIYCSSITARLLNIKIGIPWSNLHVLPLNERITISGVGVTCVDANHCPGSLIILFEPPNEKPVLHTGDFRYCEELGKSLLMGSQRIHTLILDTTYCDPRYDFPKQEAVIQFVVEAIQAESFNPCTLFLIGSYTIGKERIFMEVARVLRKKVYVGAAKMRLLECLGLPKEDMDWLTENEMESHVHVVPMWMIASFKRLSHLWKHYSNRFNLMIAFSPTGWSFGKGKKKNRALGRRWQQGTMIRYEVPYSEHSSFTELKEFVGLVSPEVIIPSVNNKGPEAAGAMVALLTSGSSSQPVTLPE